MFSGVYIKQQYCDVSLNFRKFRTKEEEEKRVFQVLTVSHVWLFPGKHYLHFNTVCYIVNLFY